MSGTRRLGFTCGILATLAVLTGPARGQLLGVDISAGGAIATVANPPNTLGWQFNVSQTITVTSLGIFDVVSNGLILSHEVGIWQLDGTLIASTTVNNSGTPVASVSGLGRWMFQSVSPTVLQAGTYVIGANFPSAADQHNSLVPTVFSGPVVTFTNGRFGANGSGFAFPVNSFTSQNGNFGPNLLYSVVPEPSSLVLSSICGGALFGLLRRRHRGA